MSDYIISYRQIKYFIFFLVFQTSSFDVVLNLRIGGFSFRFVYISILLLSLLFIVESIRNKSLKINVLSVRPFVIWSFFLIAFIPNTPLIGRNIGYILWLYIHFFFIVVCGHFFTNEKIVYKMIELYLWSFIVSSTFGLLQFFFGIVGVDLFVEQWWPGHFMPRLNGFSYEPSYYSTYLLIGLSFGYYLHRKKNILFGRLPQFTYFLALITIILSSSRMGILIAALQILCFEVFINKKKIKQLLIFITVFCIVLGSAFYVIVSNENFMFLLSGIGIMGTSAHSSLERIDGFLTQLTIFSRNPLKGYSLGGVSQAIAFEKGLTSISQETVKLYDVSINIFVEVLTASGLFGFCFFIYYLYCLFNKPLRESNNIKISIMNKQLLQALLWSLLFELIILCFNQNVLRAYLWIHVAVLSGTYFFVKTSNNRLVREASVLADAGVII